MDFSLRLFVSPTAVMRGHATVVASRKCPEGCACSRGEWDRKRARGVGVPSVIAPRVRPTARPRPNFPSCRIAGALGRDLSRHGGANGCERDSKRGARESNTPNATGVTRPSRPGSSSPAAERRNRSGLDYQRRGLANLFEIWPYGRGYLRATPVFVPHPRIALAARKLGGGRS